MKEIKKPLDVENTGVELSNDEIELASGGLPREFRVAEEVTDNRAEELLELFGKV